MKRYHTGTLLLCLLTAVIAVSFLRISLLVLYPVLALLTAVFLQLRISRSLLVMAALVSMSFVLSLLPDFFLKYNLLSLYYMLPLLLLLFADPAYKAYANVGYTRVFMKCLALVAAVNDCVGFVQVIRNPGWDDSFTGIYSQFSVSLNGLMLVNSLIFFYYFLRYIEQKKIVHLLTSLFFLSSAVLCYYGAGLVICIVAFVCSFFKLNIRSVFKTVLIGLVSVAMIYYLMLMIKPGTLNYNMTNIRSIVKPNQYNSSRKMTSFYNYFAAYPRHPKDFLFGSGPGTFNSRTAFMVGSPSYFNSVQFIKDTAQPYYFKNYAYTLWNASNTSQALYLDGFRNQPFSSVLAFLGEYGLVFTGCFFFLYFRLYQKTARLLAPQRRNADALTVFRFFKFLYILLPLLLLIDNYFEYPEIMLLLLVGMRLVQTDLIARLSDRDLPPADRIMRQT